LLKPEPSAAAVLPRAFFPPYKAMLCEASQNICFARRLFAAAKRLSELLKIRSLR
jgi:hypothetical protein